MNKGAFLSLVGLVAVMAAVVSGCGSGGDSTSSLTKAQFVKQVNALCSERTSERNQAVSAEVAKLKPGEQFSDAKQTKMVVTIVVPSYEKAIENVKSLEPPAGDSAEIEKIVKAMEKALKKVEADPRQAIFSLVMMEEANELATKYGIKACAV